MKKKFFSSLKNGEVCFLEECVKIILKNLNLEEKAKITKIRWIERPGSAKIVYGSYNEKKEDIPIADVYFCGNGLTVMLYQRHFCQETFEKIYDQIKPFCQNIIGAVG